MTYQECCDLLKSILVKREMLRSIERKMSDDERFCFVAGMDYSRPAVKGGEGESVQDRYVAHKERSKPVNDMLRKRAERLMNDIFTAEDRLAELIHFLAPLEQQIIIDHYLNGERYEDIADKMHYQVSYVKKLRGKAIHKMVRQG